MGFVSINDEISSLYMTRRPNETELGARMFDKSTDGVRPLGAASFMRRFDIAGEMRSSDVLATWCDICGRQGTVKVDALAREARRAQSIKKKGRPIWS